MDIVKLEHSILSNVDEWFSILKKIIDLCVLK